MCIDETMFYQSKQILEKYLHFFVINILNEFENQVGGTKIVSADFWCVFKKKLSQFSYMIHVTFIVWLF